MDELPVPAPKYGAAPFHVGHSAPLPVTADQRKPLKLSEIMINIAGASSSMNMERHTQICLNRMDSIHKHDTLQITITLPTPCSTAMVSTSSSLLPLAPHTKQRTRRTRKTDDAVIQVYPA